ncbi:ZMYM1 (predicted) [Pycnogonum litorale]
MHSCVKATRSYLTRQRNDTAFDQFYDSALKDAISNDVSEPTVPHYKRPPHRIDEGSTPYRFSDPKEYYRVVYFEVIDLIVQKLDQRFCQGSLDIPIAIEELIISAANAVNAVDHEIPEVLQIYKNEIDLKRLSIQLKCLPDLIRTAVESRSEFKDLREVTVTSVRTISDILCQVNMGNFMFSEVGKLLKMYLTIPVTSATAERSFSALRRLKTYLRNTMTEKRLNNVVFLNVHCNLADKTDLTLIAKAFVKVNDRRLNYFGHF